MAVPHPLRAALFGVAMGLAAGLLRLGMDRLVPGLPPFLFYFPALACATLAQGWVAGVAAIGASVAFAFAVPIPQRPDLWQQASTRQLAALLFALLGLAMLAGIERFRNRVIAYGRAVAAREQAETALALSDRQAREWAQELGAVLDAVPSAICIARDPACTVISGNRAAGDLLRVPPDLNMSKSDAAARAALGHFDVLDCEGRVLTPDAMPVQRAARGETVRDFAERLRFADGSVVDLIVNAVPLPGPAGEPRGAVAVLTDVSAMKRVEAELRTRDARRELLLHELNHRVRNMLSVVQGIAHQTLAGAVDTGVLQALDRRLLALGRAHAMLAEDAWNSADVGAIVEQALAAHRPTAGQALAEGPPIRVHARTTMALTLGLHELATNAMKHGAWKDGGGRVEVRWRVVGGERPMLELEWTESGGPPVAPPVRQGFGSRLIARGLAHDLGGTVELDFAPGGLTCRIRAALPADRYAIMGLEPDRAAAG